MSHFKPDGTVDPTFGFDRIGQPVTRAITFDFHDTLVHCDEWFELEVKHFPSAFLHWHNRNVAVLADERFGVDLDRAYRKLRLAIIQHGHELTAERCISVVFQQASLPVDDQIIADGVESLMRSALPDARAVPGAVETVNSLANNGVLLGVVSSAVHHPFLEWSLEKLGMLNAFRVVTTSASCGYYKSRPEIYWGTLHELGATSVDSIHVGDSARFDVDGAGRAGMKTVWLRRGSPPPPVNEPSLIVETLENASGVLLQLRSGARS